MRYGIFILALLFCGCAKNARQSTTSQSPLESQWLAEFELQLSHLEGSYPASEYAAANGIDLLEIRARLNQGQISVRAHPEAEYLLDHQGDRVHAREIDKNYEIAGGFWLKYFEDKDARNSRLMIHEILRQSKDAAGNARDNDGRDSRALALLSSGTRVVPSKTIAGKIQVNGRCTADTVSVEKVGPVLRIELSGVKPTGVRKDGWWVPFYTTKRGCEVRLPELDSHAPVSAKLTARVRTKTSFWGEVDLSFENGDRYTFADARQYEKVATEMKVSLKEKSLHSPLLSATTLVKVETTATSSDWGALEPEVVEIELN